MTKRRAENVLPPEVLHKRCFRSLSDNDKPFGGVNVIQNANPPTLLSVAGQRCRKRTSYREDSLDTDNLPRKVAANRSACKSRTFEDDDDAGRPVTRRSSRALQTESKKQTDEGNNITARDKVMNSDEELSPFNSFQFWRVPLPELDLSLLETEPSAGSYIAPSTKDLEAMETCCCGRLIAEHVGPYSGLLGHGPGPDSTDEEEWYVLRHTSVSPTDAFGLLDFQASTKRTCHAKYVRLSSDTPPELLVQLMLREWHMEMPKLVISVHGGTESFPLSPRVYQAFSTGLITAAESTGAWILTDGINTGVSKYVGDAVKVYGSHDQRKRNVVGITPWGIIENNSDLIGCDVFRHYQALGNPLSKRASLNGMHSHFLLVDDGTMGKSGCQIDLRKRLERHIHFQKINPRLPEHVPLVCVVVEGGPAILSVVLEYVRRSSPVPVLVFEGTGRAADLLALIHKQTAVDRKLDLDIKEDVLLRIQEMFGVERQEASELLNIIMECMEHRELITIFDSESEDLQEADAAILTTSLRGTRASPEEQLNITLAWDRADVAKDNILVYGQQWQAGSLEQTMLDALLMDRVSFVKLLIENGMSMNRFLTISRLEQLYNRHKGSSDHFLRHIIEDARQTRLPAVYRISLIDIGMVIEYLIGGAYRSTYTRKSFRAMYSRFHNPAKEGGKETSSPFCNARKSPLTPKTSPSRSHFHRTARPCRQQVLSTSPFCSQPQQ